MAMKALNFKMEEMDIMDIKKVAAVYHMTVTDVVKEAIHDYLQRAKADPFYRLTAHVEEADEEETREILSEIDSLSDEDLAISSSKQFRV